LDTLLSLAKDLNYLSEEEFERLYESREEVAKHLEVIVLIKSIVIF